MRSVILTSLLLAPICAFTPEMFQQFMTMFGNMMPPLNFGPQEQSADAEAPAGGGDFLSGLPDFMSNLQQNFGLDLSGPLSGDFSSLQNSIQNSPFLESHKEALELLQQFLGLDLMDTQRQRMPDLLGRLQQAFMPPNNA
eukprot:Gregarina_sp_Poly_1__6313@NODE_335_length_9444_cov_64_484270_g283_i0_p10_GENE_NODE_335_length_9444_cov_64_484270_g283_i0NODE_335_length_9444_cov_64_484270_g283_i0_p10_ORF_typecomplete_len140_score29_80_NODE_335_length_9444_cov_64_484270_g283_i089339352